MGSAPSSLTLPSTTTKYTKITSKVDDSPTRSFQRSAIPPEHANNRACCAETYGADGCEMSLVPNRMLCDNQNPATGDREYCPLSTTGMVTEPAEILLWVNALRANLNRQSLPRLCSNALSIPPLVKPSANMSRVSAQCIRLIMPWLKRPRTEIKCNFKEHS